MAHTGVFATKAEIDVKVGENVDATGYTEANINNACAQSESLINAITRYNYTDAYAALDADKKRILSEASACWVAIDFISYNMAGYSSRVEAEDMLSILWAKFELMLGLLQDQNTNTFIRQ